MERSDYFWQGDCVTLRPVRPDDWEVAYQGYLDSPARRLLQLGIELPQSPEMVRATTAEFSDCKEAHGAIVFAIDNLDGQNVGGISLHSRDEKNGLFGFGIVIYGPYRRKGYASDAVRILLRYGFWERRYVKCNSACAHTNEASLRLHRTLGFAEEGRRRRAFFAQGQYFDEVLFGMTREEFDELEKGRR
jgi:RimJ/RimL family protein N-acetyltransferase